MRVAIIGLGIQGRKRLGVAGAEVVATVDPVVPPAGENSMNHGTHYPSTRELPLEAFDAAMVCTPENEKLDLVEYLVENRKHVLVEKPLFDASSDRLSQLAKRARGMSTVIYTAYNHRFEPHLTRLKEVVDSGALGRIYYSRFFYGNGTARDVRNSSWKDNGLGVVLDLGSHLLDMVELLFGKSDLQLELVSCERHENRSPDFALIRGSASGKAPVYLEVSLLCWKNTFAADVIGEQGSAHVSGLCKWGPSVFTLRKRVFPSGPPKEESSVLEIKDPTWEAEYLHFKRLCEESGLNGGGYSGLEKDLWINECFRRLK